MSDGKVVAEWKCLGVWWLRFTDLSQQILYVVFALQSFASFA